MFNLLLAATAPDFGKLILIGIVVIGLSLILKRFRQPSVVAYILAGVLLGDYGFNFITDSETIQQMGEVGLILLLFFIGMEVDVNDLVARWRVALFGTSLQVLASIGLVAIIGSLLSWEWARIITLGFVVALSSSAVVIKLLQDTGETKTEIGANVISILLMQDILIVPMLVITALLGGETPSTELIVKQLFGAVVIIGAMIWIVRKDTFRLKLLRRMESDHELQVYAAVVICFGLASLTNYFGLSPALGAFIAGILVHKTESTEWFHDSLHGFRVLFVSVFFISVGLLIDLDFLLEHFLPIGLLLVTVYISNHLINASVLRFCGCSWRGSLYGGALLAQIGELSFVLVATGYYAGIISDFVYQLTILVISLTLLLSPFWIAMTKRLIHFDRSIAPANQ